MYFQSTPVVVALTSLKQVWDFFWLEEGKIRQASCKKLETAVAIIESILADDAQNVNASGVPPFARRVKFQDALNRTRTHTGETSLEMLKKRRKIEPPVYNDVASMRDVFDVMTPEEITAWRLKQWGRVLESSPFFRPILADLRETSA
jgi:hypothetical protein